jgi:membrane-associated phospholipid phosphatase
MIDPRWLVLSGCGVMILSWSLVGAGRPTIGPTEVRWFRRINGMPGWLLPVLWLPMQLGNLLVGTAVGLVLAVVDGDVAVALGTIAAMVLKLVAERVVRRQLSGNLQVRQRPGTSQPGAVLRGRDVPSSGASFPSGHVILVSAIACVVVPNLPTVWWPLPLTLTALVMIGRVYVGAHNPLDVTAGLGTGLLLGGVLATVVN